MGQPIVWYATYVDTLTLFHLSVTEMATGNATVSAEGLKRRKYRKLENSYIFGPFPIETLGRGKRRQGVSIKKCRIGI